VEKSTAGQATDDITAHAHNVLDASHTGYVIHGVQLKSGPLTKP
jgi:hypothetical protein